MKTIFRSSCRSHFTQLPNTMLRDNSISLRARGLLALCLSHSEDWVITKSWIIEQVPEGKHAVSAIFRELEASGYAVMTEQRDEVTKQFVSRTWTFYDAPVPNEARSHFSAKDADKRSDLPAAGNPVAGEPAPKNTKGEEYNGKEYIATPSDSDDLKPSPAEKKTRPRNLLFDALAKYDGWSETTPITKAAGGRVAAALEDIRSVCPQVTPEEIHRRAQNYRKRFQGIGISSTAISANWAKCNTPADPPMQQPLRRIM